MQNVFSVVTIAFLLFTQPTQLAQTSSKEVLLSMRSMSLETRYEDRSVNEVFKYNILLTLQYLNGDISREPFHSEIVLQPHEVFAFHDDILPEFQGKVVKTTNAHFNGQEGFKSDGYLMGDGVCHLASLINWAAREAGLEVVAKVNHDFANIPEVPREFGVSIYSFESAPESSALQNLYVRNPYQVPVVIRFDYDGTQLKVSILKISFPPTS